MIRIAIRNLSTAVSDADLKAALPAFQKQVTRDFFPAWGENARLRFVSETAPLKSTEWELVLIDTADQAGALGYHETTNVGTPLGKVFVKTTIDAGYSWTVTLSHELLEMLADPWITLCAIDDKADRIYAMEVCDAVEDDSLGYKIGGVLVSDFCLPSFFEADISTSDPRSFRGNVTRPFQLAPGGYLSFIDLRKASRGWQQENARRVGTSRGETRRLKRANSGRMRFSR